MARPRGPPGSGKQGERTLTDLEKTFTVLTGAERAFEFLADPSRLPDYVSTIRLEDSTAVEGELDIDADIAGRDGAAEAGFTTDRSTRRIEWGRPDSDYGGSIVVTVGTTNSAGVTVRLHTRDDADVAEVTRIFEQTVSNIRLALSGR